MQFRVLGPIEAHTDEGVPIACGGRKPTVLLAALLCNANAWVSVDQLIDAIWHQQVVPDAAASMVRHYGRQLRRLLGDRLESKPGAFRVRVLSGELDLERAEAMGTAAREAMSTGAYPLAVEHLTGALALWRGAPLEGLDFACARAAATRLDELNRDLGALLADAYLALGRTGDATAVLRVLTEWHPLWQSGWARLVRALCREGRPEQAIAAYDQAKRIIASELGAEPGPELSAAGHEIPPKPRSGRLSLVGPAPTVGRAGLDALLASASDEVLIMSSSGGDRLIGLFRRLDHENLRRGVRYRVLFPDSARLSGTLNSLSLAGAEVRTEAEVPMECMVIDGVAVALPADGAGIAVFRLPGVVAAAMGLFERIWPTAAPLIPTDPSEATSGLTSRERALLDLLCSGVTDESAGARLGISVRTVRRMVADIMNRLGARSRFQAGVKLADRGWLLDKAC